MNREINTAGDQLRKADLNPGKHESNSQEQTPLIGIDLLKTWFSRRQWLLKPVLHR
jgi:hypothetical protein